MLQVASFLADNARPLYAEITRYLADRLAIPAELLAGVGLEELTFRTIYTARNAALQIQAHTLGLVSPLNPAETRLAGEYNLRPGPVMRAWEYWNARLDKAEGGRAQVRKHAPKKSASRKKRRR